MANYPDWVLKNKKKGTYINHTNGRYYLYAGHSERIKGTKKVKRICDGYLGRITEEDGLIPPKDKVSGDVEVLEYGLCSTIIYLSKDIYSGFKSSFKSNADFVLVSAILAVIYGTCNYDVFKSSYTSVIFPDVDINKNATAKQCLAIDRGVLMINDILTNLFGNNKSDALTCLQTLYKVKINQKYYTSKENETLKLLKEKYNLKWWCSNG